MLVKEKSKTNSLIEYARQRSYTGTGNYISTARDRYRLTTNELERIAFPNIFEEANETNEDSNIAYIVTTESGKSDLPLTTDIVDDFPPEGLIYARLEGLQYYTKPNNF